MLAMACTAEAPRPRLVDRSFVSMGSSLRVALWATDEALANAAADQVFREFDRLESLLSVWKPGSDVARLNESAGRQPVTVSQETLEVLTAARMGSEWTGGKFDITFGALADIWKFDHDQDNSVPARAAIEARLPLVDYRAIQIDASKRTAFITKPGVRVHLGGVGKGYAIDVAAVMLKQQGFRDFLIQAGGDMYAAGANNGAPWKLGIADPRGSHDAFAGVEIRDATLSTSGDYERSFVKDGVRYHHILDPDVGEPARGCRSVTIVADRATVADVLSTGVFIMGPREGMELIEKLPNVEGVIVTAFNEVLISSGLKGRVEIKGPPTDAP
ncbi:MAG TPA: FAD:protein FMN transferase [Vicinamibacterales bacterium]|nr:FAD:protein FMN transferase [Vicinamibacterales bacterium]